jgi:uncharacterized protein
MDDVVAREKYPCAACGAQAEWNASKQLLVCPFCGTAAPFSVDKVSGAIEEHDLAKALRELPDAARGWLAQKRTVQCQSCKAVSVFDPERVGQNCDFCGSPALVDYEEIKAPIRPQSVLPFKVSESHVREQIRTWFASKWLAPNAFKKRALVDRIHGVYIPYWTFDAQAHCPWEAEAGHYYYTTQTYRDNQGKTRTRQVRHVRWVPASGVVDHFFDDEPVPGTNGVSHALLRQIEPFQTSELVPYDTAYLSGFVVEHYQIVLLDAAQESEEAMTSQLRSMCIAQIPGDTHRNLELHPTFSARTFKHILVPVWLLAYQYRTKTYQVVVNGHDGRMAGQYPKSPWKVAALVLAIIMALLLGLFLTQAVEAASFDCQKASSTVEKRICANKGLSTLDEHLGRYYNGALTHMASAAECLRMDQRAWLKERNACPDVGCIEDLILRRLSELDGLQPGANAIEGVDLPAVPVLEWIIPPAEDEIAAPRGLPEEPSTIEGRIADEIEDGGELVVVDGKGASTVLTLLMTADGETVERLRALAARDATYLVRGSRLLDEDGRAYLDPARCVFVYRAPRE